MHFFNDHNVEEAIVQTCFGCDGDVIAKLVAVGDGNKKCINIGGKILCFDSEIKRLCLEILHRRKLKICFKSPYFPVCKFMSNLCVAANSAHHTRKLVIYFEAIYKRRSSIKNYLKRSL